MEKVAMIIQPDEGLVSKTRETRSRAAKSLEEMGYKNSDDVVHTDFINQIRFKDDNLSSESLLRQSFFLRKMAYCSTLYLCKGWDDDPKAVFKVFAGMAHGLEILLEPGAAGCIGHYYHLKQEGVEKGYAHAEISLYHS